jgi:transcriptional regulator with PAS, ATPase and Fis domain
MGDFVMDDETRRVVPNGRTMQVVTVELAVVDGPSRGATYRVTGPIARVGTAEGSHLRLADPTVSRLHCELSVRPDGVTLRDLGSTNGTFIGDVRVHEVEVKSGTAVRVGASVFRVETGDSPSFLALSDRTELGELVGGSVEMREVYAVIERAAPADTTLLIQGETGTGKDVAARAVHALSRRAAGPFVPVDCGAIPENLIESELFGHVRGAFTGAVSNRKGAFEEAHGGTLFLDEIGELPLAMQPKLLRALESRTIRPVGAGQGIPVDVRIIAATNRQLARCVNDATFREDLYYRLAVVELTLPPLRARREDIPRLANRFYERLVGPAPAAALAQDFVEPLLHRAWPGNVRELRNFIERAVTLGQARTGAGAAPPALGATAGVLPAGIERIVPLHRPLKEARDAWMEAFESIYIRAMLDATGGNLTRAAERAGVSRRFLQRTIARLGLRDRAVDDDDDD